MNGRARDADDDRPTILACVGRCRARRTSPIGGPGEHDAEQEEHDDGADVDEHLGDGDELGRQQDELGGHAGEHHHQVERGVHHVLGGDHPDAASTMPAAMT